MATSMMSYEHARRERLKESGMSEATATAIADALTSLRNEITADITARIDTKFNWAVVLMTVGFAALGIIIAVTNGDSGPDIHNIYTTPVPLATAVAEILPGR